MVKLLWCCELNTKNFLWNFKNVALRFFNYVQESLTLIFSSWDHQSASLSTLQRHLRTFNWKCKARYKCAFVYKYVHMHIHMATWLGYWQFKKLLRKPADKTGFSPNYQKVSKRGFISEILRFAPQKRNAPKTWRK